MDTQQKLAFLVETLGRIGNAEQELRPRAHSPVDQYFLGKIDEWASKIMGVTSGYAAEFDLMYKHRVEKYRTLVSGHADVTIGDPGEVHARSVQLKSTLGDHSDVSSMIKVALNQLSGERGEHPRPNDRLVVDMNILNAANTWPAGANTLGTLNWQQFANTAKEKLLALCSEDSYRKHVSEKGKQRKEGFGVSPALRGTLTDLQGKGVTALNKHPYMGHRNSTQMLAVEWGKHPSQGSKVIHLTFKIRYHHGYPIITGTNLLTNENKYGFVHLAVFNVYRVGDALQIDLPKVLMFTDTGFTRVYPQ